MKYINFKVLLLGGLFFIPTLSTSAETKVLFSDVFVYKISDQVYSLRDLEQMNRNFNILKCYYPNSLLLKVFKELVEMGNMTGIFDIKDYTKSAYSKNQIKYFEKSIKLYKLKYYSDSHKTSVKKDVVKAFYMASRKLTCTKKIFISSSEFSPLFNDIMKMEIFLRSRYLPEERSGKKNKAEIIQAIVGIKTLLNSINKQVGEETYW